MIDLIKSENNFPLTPNQVSLIIISNGKLSETETDYTLTVETGHADAILSWSVAKELVPGLDVTEIQRLLGDTIYRQYLVIYNSSRRLQYDQSSKETSEPSSQSDT